MWILIIGFLLCVAILIIGFVVAVKMSLEHWGNIHNGLDKWAEKQTSE
jgi:hypothetical protein